MDKHYGIEKIKMDQIDEKAEKSEIEKQKGKQVQSFVQEREFYAQQQKVRMEADRRLDLLMEKKVLDLDEQQRQEQE